MRSQHQLRSNIELWTPEQHKGRNNTKANSEHLKSLYPGGEQCPLLPSMSLRPKTERHQAELEQRRELLIWGTDGLGILSNSHSIPEQLQ